MRRKAWEKYKPNKNTKVEIGYIKKRKRYDVEAIYVKRDFRGNVLFMAKINTDNHSTQVSLPLRQILYIRKL